MFFGIITKMSDKLTFIPATVLLQNYASGKLSPVDVTKEALELIRKHNPSLNAYYLVDEEGALKAARESESRWLSRSTVGPLDGIPTSIKDHQLTKGWASPRGSLTTDPNEPWTEDSPAVARLRESGAVFLGKTTMPEFGWKGVTDSELFGVTRNPWNQNKTPGGSSGGASAALASGMGQLALGSDGGGSIRIPCALTGLFGLKPTFGRVPLYPSSPMGTLSHVGPMSRRVADSALMLNVISKPDYRDWFAQSPTDIDYLEGIDLGVSGLRMAYSPTLGYAKVESEVAELVEAVAQKFIDLGAIVEELDPGFSDPTEMFMTHWYAGAANALRGKDEEKLKKVEESFMMMAQQGQKITAVEYLAAVSQRTELALHMDRFFFNWDLLITPAVSVPAFDVGQIAPKGYDDLYWTQWTPFTYPFNLTQQPAASLPCGFTADGLPVGVQLVGAKNMESIIFRAAQAYETVSSHLSRFPDL